MVCISSKIDGNNGTKIPFEFQLSHAHIYIYIYKCIWQNSVKHPPTIKPSVRHCRASRSKSHLSLLCCNQWVKTVDHQCHHLSQVVLQNPSDLHPLDQWQSDILPCTPAETSILCIAPWLKQQTFQSSKCRSSTRRIKSSRAFVGSMFLALGHQTILVHLTLDQLVPSMQILKILSNH